MSVEGERNALDPSVPLLEHAWRLHRLNPDGPLPDGGRLLPDGDEPPHVPPPERRAALAVVLREFIDGRASFQDLHDRCGRLPVNARDVEQVLPELASEPPRRLLEAARWLIENGTDQRAVLVGLGLLGDDAERRDVPSIRMIGLLSFAARSAVKALTRISTAARDLVWLAERSRVPSRIAAVKALAWHTDPVVRDWVRSTPRELLSSDLARTIAEAHDLVRLLERADVDDALWDQVGNLLLAMSCTRDHRSEVGEYRDALTVYRRWIDLADRRPATLERAALLASITEDLRTGPAAMVAGTIRGELIEPIETILTSGTWTGMWGRSARSVDLVEARRAAWVLEETSRSGVPDEGFAVRVVVPDPRPAGFPQVEARIVIDGIPVVATAFDKGPAESPEYLVHSGRLRAASEPKEIRLAKAYCHEGCCGGLYVTIAREGAEVVWRDWRSSAPGDPPREVRFDAAEYDREVARAEQDHSWEWPARTVARLLVERLRAEPGVLGRWDCARGWCTAQLQDFGTARLTFTHPARSDFFEDPSVQFGLVIDVEDRAPEDVAAQVVESLRNTDPKSFAEIIGGTRDGAEKLGLVRREPSRW